MAGEWNLFWTAAARDADFRSDKAPIAKPYGRLLPEGATVEVFGSRHANSADGTLCGISRGDIVLLGTAFAPDEPGACNECVVEARRLNEADRSLGA